MFQVPATADANPWQSDGRHCCLANRVAEANLRGKEEEWERVEEGQGKGWEHLLNDCLLQYTVVHHHKTQIIPGSSSDIHGLIFFTLRKWASESKREDIKERENLEAGHIGHSRRISRWIQCSRRIRSRWIPKVELEDLYLVNMGINKINTIRSISSWNLLGSTLATGQTKSHSLIPLVSSSWFRIAFYLYQSRAFH